MFCSCTHLQRRETKSLPKVTTHHPEPVTLPIPAPSNANNTTQQQTNTQTLQPNQQPPSPSVPPANANQVTPATTTNQQPALDPLHAQLKQLMVIVITKQLRNIEMPTIEEAIGMVVECEVLTLVDAGSLGTIAFAVSDVAIGGLNLTTNTLQATSNGPIIELKLYAC